MLKRPHFARQLYTVGSFSYQRSTFCTDDQFRSFFVRTTLSYPFYVPTIRFCTDDNFLSFFMPTILSDPFLYRRCFPVFSYADVPLRSFFVRTILSDPFLYRRSFPILFGTDESFLYRQSCLDPFLSCTLGFVWQTGPRTRSCAGLHASGWKGWLTLFVTSSRGGIGAVRPFDVRSGCSWTWLSSSTGGFELLGGDDRHM